MRGLKREYQGIWRDMSKMVGSLRGKVADSGEIQAQSREEWNGRCRNVAVGENEDRCPWHMGFISCRIDNLSASFETIAPPLPFADAYMK